MQGKTPQQRIIVSKRDEEDKRRKLETEKNSSAIAAAHDPSAPIDKDTSPALLMNFREFLHSIKHLTDNGIDCRLSRLRWVEDTCEQSAAFLTSDIQTMFKSRSLIYQKADSQHKAGNYYNALMLCYEYVHGKECPRINSKQLE